MIKLFIFSIFCFIIFSCGGANKQIDISTVDIGLVNERDIPDIDPKSRVGNYGPSGNNQKVEDSAKTSLGVLIGPGLYRSLKALDILSCLERSEVNVQLVSGVGFSSVVASLYAMDMSSERIKWLLTNQINASKDIEPFSDEWSRTWTDFVKKHVEINQIKLSEKSLWFLKADGDLKFISKYSLEEQWEKNLVLSSKKFLLKKKLNYNFAIEKLPIDKLLFLNFLSEDTEGQNLSEFAKGLYRKTYSYIPKESSDKVIILNLNQDKASDFGSVHVSELRSVCNDLRSKIE